jgi:uncharacterized protein
VSDAWLELLDHEECLVLLGAGVVGRIAFVQDHVPVVLPINYRLVERSGQTPGSWIAIRTRPGNIIETAPFTVAFEIDGFEPSTHEGWSVLVQGDLYRIDSDVAEIRTGFDSEPWLTDERDAWLLIQPFSISGRRLHGETQEWVFHSAADL